MLVHIEFVNVGYQRQQYFKLIDSSKNDHIYILFVNLGRAVLILKVTMQIGFINLCMACASSSANFENSVKKGIFHVFYS